MAPLSANIEPSTVDEIELCAQMLLRQHAEEAEPDLAEKLEPEWAVYRKAEKDGQLIIFAAWAGELMVGYAVAVVVPDLHYSGRLICQHDLLFVGQEWRRSGVGRRLIEELRAEAVRHGADVLLMHAKVGSGLQSLLPRLGFRPEETIFREDL